MTEQVERHAGSWGRRRPKDAPALLEEWLDRAARSRLAPFVKLGRTIRKHAAGILAYLDTRMTNGPVEGINNKLRVIARRAYGFTRPARSPRCCSCAVGASNWLHPYPHSFEEILELPTSMSIKSGLLPGMLDLLILKTISLGRLHGYGVMLRSQQISGDLFSLRQGSHYPALNRLEHEGLIESEWGDSEARRRAKYYRLTPAGRRLLREETARWERLAEAMAAALRATRTRCDVR